MHEKLKIGLIILLLTNIMQFIGYISQYDELKLTEKVVFQLINELDQEKEKTLECYKNIHLNQENKHLIE